MWVRRGIKDKGEWLSSGGWAGCEDVSWAGRESQKEHSFPKRMQFPANNICNAAGTVSSRIQVVVPEKHLYTVGFSPVPKCIFWFEQDE